MKLLRSSAVVVLLMAAGCSSDTPTSLPLSRSTHQSATAQVITISKRLTTLSIGGEATVRVPANWKTTPYRGEPATVYFPTVFISTAEFKGSCSTGRSRPQCTTQNYFPAGWSTPADGMVILWSQAEFPSAPGGALRHIHGRRTKIDGRAAKIWTGPAASSCPANSASELDASVRDEPRSDPGERFDLTACFGATAAPDVHSAVSRMLHSIHVRQ